MKNRFVLVALFCIALIRMSFGPKKGNFAVED